MGTSRPSAAGGCSHHGATRLDRAALDRDPDDRQGKELHALGAYHSDTLATREDIAYWSQRSRR